MTIKDPVYDVAIIGAGVVGAAIARQLSRYELQCVLVEAGDDVGAGTSKANTAIWHTGFDAKPGTLECRLLRRSYALLEHYVAEAGVPVERLGAILVAWTGDQAKALPQILDRAHQNGVTDVRRLTAEEIYHLEPHLNPGVLGGLLVPGESIICTFTLPLAYATEAVLNGVDLRLRSPVRHIARAQDGLHILGGSGFDIRSRFVVNAAGLFSDEVDHMLGHHRFAVTPRRGELAVFDKAARALVQHVLLPVPTALGKGVLISPTVYGNVMLGPTAEDLDDKTETGTSAQGLEFLWQKGRVMMSALLQEEVTATYAGLRAATEHSDYQIYLHTDQRYICVGGIRSTGLSASLGIAEHVVELMGEAGLPLHRKPDCRPVHMPYIGEAGIRPYQSEDWIAHDPDCGRIVCYCERVTLGELTAAAHAVIPATTIDGLRRRTRALQGRCQGFHCHASLVQVLARETGQNAAELTGLESRHGA